MQRLGWCRASHLDVLVRRPTRRGLAKPTGSDPTAGRSGADCSRPRDGGVATYHPSHFSHDGSRIDSGAKDEPSRLCKRLLPAFAKIRASVYSSPTTTILLESPSSHRIPSEAKSIGNQAKTSNIENSQHPPYLNPALARGQHTTLSGSLRSTRAGRLPAVLIGIPMTARGVSKRYGYRFGP